MIIKIRVPTEDAERPGCIATRSVATSKLHLMANSRYKILNPQQPHFLTMTVVNWLPVFATRPIAQILLDSLQFLQEQKRLTLYAYVILENHAHLVAQADDLSKEIGDFKSYTARSVIDYLHAKNAQRVLKQLGYYKLQHKTDRRYQLW